MRSIDHQKKNITNHNGHLSEKAQKKENSSKIDELKPEFKQIIINRRLDSTEEHSEQTL